MDHINLKKDTMNNLKLLTKFFLCSLILMLFNSCSSDIDELNDIINADGTNKDSKALLKINNSNYQEHVDYSSNNQANHTFTWKNSKNSDGTNRFSVRGEVDYISAPTEISLQGSGSFDIDINSEIKQGQIYDVKSSNFEFSISFGGLSNVSYNLQDNTIGQLKVTFFDGVTMSGEFSFDKIRFYRGDNWQNDTTKITGSFTKIEQSKP